MANIEDVSRVIVTSLSNPRRLLAIMVLPFLVIADLIHHNVDYLDNNLRPKLISEFKDMFHDFYYSKAEIEVMEKQAQAQAEAYEILKEKMANPYDVHEFNYRGLIFNLLVIRYGKVEDIDNEVFHNAEIVVHETDDGVKLKKCNVFGKVEAGNIYMDYLKQKELKNNTLEKLANRL